MRIIVAGAVSWEDKSAIHRELVDLPDNSTIIHGDSPGADALAGEIARQLGLSVEPMAKSKEDYAKYKRGAWKALNERMLASDTELVLVFHPNIEASRGSKHLVTMARTANIEVRIFRA